MICVETIFRNSISTADWLALSPGATIVLTDSIYTDETATESKHSSFSTQLYIQLKVVLFCLLFTEICNLYYLLNV